MFLTHLAVHVNVAPSTQNQAMNALVFLYRKVLKQELPSDAFHVERDDGEDVLIKYS